MTHYEYLCNEVEHKQYVDAINKDPKYCVYCGKAIPGYLFRKMNGFCIQCWFDDRDIKQGFVTREHCDKRIAENKRDYPYFYQKLECIQQEFNFD